MATWVWLNLPLAAVIFAAMVGIPTWMVFRHPDGPPTAGELGHARRYRAVAAETHRTGRPVAVVAAAAVEPRLADDWRAPGRAAQPDETAQAGVERLRELAGAGR